MKAKEKVYYLLGVVYRFTPDGVEGEVRGYGFSVVPDPKGGGYLVRIPALEVEMAADSLDEALDTADFVVALLEGEVYTASSTGRASVSKTGGSGFESPAVRQKETWGQTETEVRWQMMVKRIGEGFLAKDEKDRLLTWAHPVFGGEPGGMMLTAPRGEGLEWRYFRSPEEALSDPEAAPLAQAVLEAYRNQG